MKLVPLRERDKPHRTPLEPRYPYSARCAYNWQYRLCFVPTDTNQRPGFRPEILRIAFFHVCCQHVDGQKIQTITTGKSLFRPVHVSRRLYEPTGLFCDGFRCIPSDMVLWRSQRRFKQQKTGKRACSSCLFWFSCLINAIFSCQAVLTFVSSADRIPTGDTIVSDSVTGKFSRRGGNAFSFFVRCSKTLQPLSFSGYVMSCHVV